MINILARNIGWLRDKIETQIKRLRVHGGGALALRKNALARAQNDPQDALRWRP